MTPMGQTFIAVPFPSPEAVGSDRAQRDLPDAPGWAAYGRQHSTAHRAVGAAEQRDQLAPSQLMALHLVPYQPSDLQDIELAAISQRV
jgi:hypothetical protein